jgi:hypothetical protein
VLTTVLGTTLKCPYKVTLLNFNTNLTGNERGSAKNNQSPMIKTIATILLITNVTLGLFVWLQDHDDTKLRVIRLGIVISLAGILLFTIYLVDG